MFPDVGDRETFEQTLKITNISATMFLTFGQGQGFSLAKYVNLFLDRVNRMYIYIFSVLFDTGGFFYLTQICIELGC
jgi:hypothetical protein